MNQLESAELERLRRLDSSSVANAIESFDVRLRNAGFTNSTIRCLFPDLPPMVGYAATARVHTSEPPMKGHSYYDRTDWWNHILSIPAPRIVVVEDVDKRPGLGAFVGRVHANILSALGCSGIVTNGAVRDLRGLQAVRLPIFAANMSVSHAYAHIFDFGGRIRVGDVDIAPGDLLHGDAGGVQTVPLEIAPKLADVAAATDRHKERLVAFCRSPGFSVEGLRRLIQELDVPQSQDLRPTMDGEREKAL